MRRPSEDYPFLPISTTVADGTTVQVATRGQLPRGSVDVYNDGTTGALTIHAGEFSPWCLTFNGTSTVAGFDGAATVLAAIKHGTIEIGFQIDSTGSGARTLLALGDTNAETAFWLKIDASGKLEANLVVAGTEQWTWTSTSALETNAFLGLTVKHDGVAPTFVLDNGGPIPGAFSVSTDKTAWLSALTGLDNANLGALDYNSAGNADFFKGEIDYLYVFDNPKRRAGDLQLRYDVDEGTGTTLTDETDNSNDGTIANGTWETKPGVTLAGSSGRVLHREDDAHWFEGMWASNASGGNNTITLKPGKVQKQ